MGLGTERFEKMASKMMLKVREEGQGKKGNKKPVLFPKIVFLSRWQIRRFIQRWC